MARPLRIEYPGALYHITSRGNERRKIFLDDADRLKFLELLKDYYNRFSILIHSYAIMDNHYHLILETPKGNLLKVMHAVNSNYTGYFNRKYGRAGHLFQGRYKGILVDKDEYLVRLSIYVHLNPVRARMVEKPEQYKWSSYPSFIGKAKEHKWLEYSWVLSKFGNDKKTAQRKYGEHTEKLMTEKMKSPMKDVCGQLILGRDNFIDKVKGLLKGKSISCDIPERKRLMKNPSADEIISKVAEAFKVSDKEIRNKQSRNNTARKASIYFVQRYSGLSNSEISKLFGGLHYSTVSKASGRLKSELDRDKKLAKLINSLDSHFKA